MLTLLSTQFADPPAAYRPMMFWVWNGAVTPELIDADIADMKAKGCGGFFIHPMGEKFRLKDFIEGISPPYLSDEYFELVRHAVDKAAEAGMYAWLYDEGGWPSGTAQGHVVDGHPELAGKVLSVVAAADPAASPPEGTVVTIVLTQGQAPAVVPDAASAAAADSSVLHFVQRTGGYPVDMMDPAAVRRFIEVTHERYREYVGEHFGKTVPGMFTDEPRVGGRVGSGEIPWTPRMLEAFESEHGFDLRPWLPLLFSEQALGLRVGEHYSPGNLMAVRCAFFDTWTRLHREAYWDQLNAWCRENGLLHIGHVGGEDNLPDHIRGGFGEFFRTAGTLDVPGVDAIWRQLWHGQANRHYPVLAASAAHQKAPDASDREWPASGLAATESFGVYGLGLNFEGMKWVTDYQFVRGVNLLGPMARSMFTDNGRLYRTMDHMGPGNPLWEHYGAFADYVGRLSAACRAGERAATIAVYYPIESLWAGEAGETPGSFETICALLEDQQIQYDVIGGDAVLASTIEEEALVTPGAAYDTVIMPEVRALRGSVARRLVELRQAGGRLVFIGGGPEWIIDGSESRPGEEAMPELLEGAFPVELPKEQDRLMAAFGGSPGYAHVSRLDGFSSAYMAGPWLDRFAGHRLIPGAALVVPEDNLGPFALLLGLTAVRVRLSLTEPVEGIRLLTRALDRTTIHLLVNEGDEDAECELGLAADEPLRLETWDPDTGERAVLAYHDDVAEGTTVNIALAPFGSVVIVAVPPELLEEPAAPETAALTSSFTAGPAALPEAVSGWEIRHGAVVPRQQLPAPARPAGELESGRWEQAEGWEDFSGTVAYRARFEAPAEWRQRRVAVELRDVHHAAEVWVNGQHAGHCLWRPYLLDIAHLLYEGENEVVVQVTNTLANQALKADAMDEAKSRGWWNTYCDRAEPMMRESLPSGMEPMVLIWLSGDEDPL